MFCFIKTLLKIIHQTNTSKLNRDKRCVRPIYLINQIFKLYTNPKQKPRENIKLDQVLAGKIKSNMNYKKYDSVVSFRRRTGL